MQADLVVDKIILYRPVNDVELRLVKNLGWKAFPPRLPDQPIFYPVLDLDYAIKITRDWNVPQYGHGYVLSWEMNSSILQRWPMHMAGGDMCKELWVEAQDMDDFNRLILGEIKAVCEYHAETDFSDL